MGLVKRKPRNFNPFQLAAFSGSTAIDYMLSEERSSTLESIPKEYQVSSGYQLSDRPTESSDLLSKMNDSVEQYNISRQKDQVVHLKPVTFVKSRFIELQRWEGIVIEVSEDSFNGRLINLSQNDHDSEAEFSFNEVHDEDKSFIMPGSIFYWTIGYKEDRGQRIRASMIRFRRLPAWQREEIEAAKRSAQNIKDLLQWK
jgi:hypothetical protein